MSAGDAHCCLLSGLLECGVCGGSCAKRGQDRDRYGCSTYVMAGLRGKLMASAADGRGGHAEGCVLNEGSPKGCRGRCLVERRLVFRASGGWRASVFSVSCLLGAVLCS